MNWGITDRFLFTSILKVHERLVYNRIFKFIDDHNILYNQQFRFRKNHSTYLAINALVTKFHESAENSEFMLYLLTYPGHSILYPIRFFLINCINMASEVLPWNG